MRLRSIQFGPLFISSSARGFLGKVRAFAYANSKKGAERATFIAPRAALGRENSAQVLRPRRKLEFGAGVMVEANPDARLLAKILADTALVRQPRPFLIAIVLEAAAHEERCAEAREVAALVQKFKDRTNMPFGIELHAHSFAPGLSEEEYLSNLCQVLQEFSALAVPMVLGLSVLVPPPLAALAAESGLCDAVSVSEPIAWNDVPEHVREVFFRTQTSPLAEFGGGNVSGKYLAPLAAEWIRQVRQKGVRAPIIACNCIVRASDVAMLHEAGASAIVLDAALALSPWNIGAIIEEAEKLFI